MSLIGKIVTLEYFGKTVNGCVTTQKGAHLTIKLGGNHKVKTTINHIIKVRK